MLHICIVNVTIKTSKRGDDSATYIKQLFHHFVLRKLFKLAFVSIVSVDKNISYDFSNISLPFFISNWMNLIKSVKLYIFYTYCSAALHIYIIR